MSRPSPPRGYPPQAHAPRHGPGLLALLVLLVLLWGAGAVSAMEDRRIFRTSEQTVAVARVEDVADLNTRLLILLREVNPRYAGAPPLEPLVGPALRDPSLRGLAPNAWVEAVAVLAEQAGSVEWVWVAPTRGPGAFLREMALQVDVLEENRANGVRRYRQTRPEGAIQFHLAFEGDTVLIAPSLPALEAVLPLYREDSGRGLLRTDGGDLRVVINNRRGGEIVRRWMKGARSRLVADIGSGEEPPAMRGIFAILEDAYRESLRTEMRASLRRGAIVADLSIRFAEDGAWGHALATSSGEAGGAGPWNASPPRLPVGATVAQVTDLWSGGTESLLESYGELLGKLVGLSLPDDAIGEAARGDARAILAAILAARPLRHGGAWIPPPRGQERLGPVLVQWIDWGRPAAAPRVRDVLLKRLATVADGPVGTQKRPLAEQLERMGIKVTVRHDPSPRWSSSASTEAAAGDSDPMDPAAMRGPGGNGMDAANPTPGPARADGSRGEAGDPGEDGATGLAGGPTPSRVAYVAREEDGMAVYDCIVRARLPGWTVGAPGMLGRPVRYVIHQAGDRTYFVCGGIPADDPRDEEARRLLIDALRAARAAANAGGAGEADDAAMGGRSPLTTAFAAFATTTPGTPPADEVRGQRPILRVGGHPLALYRTALLASMAWPSKELASGSEPPWGRYLRELALFSNDGPPVTWGLLRVGPRLTLRCVAPRRTLVETGQAALGLGSEATR